MSIINMSINVINMSINAINMRTTSKRIICTGQLCPY